MLFLEMIIIKIGLLVILSFIFITTLPFCIGWLLSGDIDDDIDLTIIYAWLVCIVLFMAVVVLWATVPCPFAIR